ncbi:MAG: hypothetical protein NVS4B11_15390 [Ktedonobacteraceae bacterium]
MSSSLKVVVSSIIVVVLLAVAVIWVNPGLHSHTSTAHAAAATNLPYTATANGPYSVKGNSIVGANGQQYLIHGIARDGLEYNCSGEGPLDQQHLAYLGTGVNTTTGTYWGANTVRLPLSEGFWLKGAPGFPCTAAQYQNTVKQVVATLTALKLNVILDLQWTDAGGQSGQGGGPWAMADADSVVFWQQVAPIYKGYSNVLFEAYNEPHPATWACWTGACTMTNDSGYSDDCLCPKTFTYPGVGMQALVNAIRGAGANNLILAAGMGWGYDLSQLNTYKLTGTNIVYDTHPYYPYTDKLPAAWDNAFGIASQTYPVISAESGEYDCDSNYMGQLLSYFDAHQIGWIGFSWSTRGNTCSYPLLITDYNGTPSAGYGLYIYQHLHRYAPTPAPVNSVWYFAEGRVGASFKEYLTIDNPDPNNDCPVSVQYLPETGATVTKSFVVARASRWTESVNADMGIPDTQPTGLSVSAIVSVTRASCSGVVAERPQYFSWHGISSGSDVVGATHLGQTFYFADIPTNNGYTSFLTALNPPANGIATVTATYYANGRAVGSAQSINLNAGQRGTLFPSSNGLPTHVAAVITSTLPIVVERPDYFSHVGVGSAGSVSGATSVVGTQTLSHDWLFAEGFTGGKTQEYLAISNLDSVAKATANVTITLQLGGSTKVVTLSVGSMSQTLWNVNANIPPNAVSAEVTSTGAAIVVQREMFFQYSHTITSSNGFGLSASGGSDIIGQVGPATANSYTFAEGYANVGYNEWLTLQNPTSSDETITITLVNGYGHSYTSGGILVRAHTRSTVDVAALVRQYLLSTGIDPRSSCAIAMTAQAAPGSYFVAERPMYWNTGSTQGGSDVIGYAGA